MELLIRGNYEEAINFIKTHNHDIINQELIVISQ